MVQASFKRRSGTWHPGSHRISVCRQGTSWTPLDGSGGSSIMMSVLLRPDFEPQYASMLTLVMGLSVAQAVRELDIEVSIKW